MKKSILNFASTISIASLIFAPLASFASPEFTYNSDTKIDADNPDVADGALDGGIIMTNGKLQLYNGFTVLGDINSDVAGTNELAFEGNYTLAGNIGNNKHFLLTSLQGEGTTVNLNEHELYVEQLFMNGHTIIGDVIVHKNGYINGIAGSVNGVINGVSSGVGSVHFVRNGQGADEQFILGNIGQTNKMDNIKLSSASGSTHTVNLNDYSISANTINIESSTILSAQAEGTGRMINGDIIIASGGVANLWGGYVVSGDAKGLEDGVGVINVQSNNESPLIFEFRGGSMGTAAQSLEEVNILEDGILTLSGNGSIYATTIEIEENATLNIDNGTIDGAINGSEIAGAAGTLNIYGNANILGAIGEINPQTFAALDEINVELGATFTINNKVHATTINNKGGTIDFSNTDRTVNANVVSMENSSGAYNFRAGDHTIEGTFDTMIGNELSFNVNDSSQGSLTSEEAITMAVNNENDLNYAVKLKLDISGLDTNNITAGTTEYTLISGAADSAMTGINDSFITVGDSRDGGGNRIYGSNTYKHLNFNTRLDGDNLILTFSENNSIFTVEEGDDAAPTSNITEKSIIIESGASLTMSDIETDATNITVFGVLNTGSNTLNAFISGYSAGAGVVNIEGLDATYVSNGNIGYVHRLSDVNILAGNTLDLSVNDNFIDAANINIGNDATLNAGAGDITGSIILGEGATLNAGTGDINGTIQGSIYVAGRLVLDSNKTITHDIGTQAPLEVVEISDGGDGVFSTINMRNMNMATRDFKIGSGATVNVSGAIIFVNSISDTSTGEGRSSGQTLNISDSQFIIGSGLILGDESVINIGESVEIEGDITQHLTDNLGEKFGGGGIINISNNFISNGNFSGLDGTINLLDGADFNISNNANTITGYDVVLSDGSNLIIGDGVSNMNIEGAESGYGKLEVSGNAEINGNIGEANSLRYVEVNYNKLKFSGNIIAADEYISISGHGGDLRLTEDTTITTTYFLAGNNTKLNIEENSHNITGSLRMIEGSSLLTSVSSAEGVNSHGKISSNGDMSTIQSGVKLRISALSDVYAESSNLLFENLYETPENINQIADGNIYINERHTNSVGNFLFKTEVVEGSLKLNITQLTQALNIYAADGDEFNYSQGNTSENDVATNIREVTEINLMDSGATLSMGSGVITRKVNLAEGSVLNTGSGEIVEEIAAMDGRYQGTVNIKDHLELVANLGAENRELEKISIQNNSLLGLEKNSILAQEIEIISGDLGIRDSRAEVAAGVIAGNYAETARTNIRLGASGRLTLDIDLANDEDEGLNNSIHANVSGITDGVGLVNIAQNFKSDYLAIGSQSNKIGSLVIEYADAVLGSSIYSAYIEVGNGDDSASLSTAGSIEANQIVIGDYESTLSVDGGIKVAAPIEGDEDTQEYGIVVGEESTLVAKEWIYKNYTQEDILENTKITLRSDATLQTYGTESVLAATIDGDSAVEGFLKIGDESIGDNETAIATTTHLYGSIGEENALEEIIVGIDAKLIANPNAAEYPNAINISAQTIELRRNAELTASGRLSGGLNDDEDGYNNANINLYNGSVLTLNSGAEIFGVINGVHDGEEEQLEALGRGTVAFANSAQPTNFALSAHIGDNTRIDSISVGQNVEVQAASVGVYTQSLSLGQNSNFLSGILHSSNVTIDTNNIERGLIATDLDYTVLNMTSSATSSLTITSGKVTGVGNYLLGFNTNANANTTITVGQNSLEENDSAAILSNTASGKNIIHLENTESIELTVENKATGTISTNGGTVFNLAQGENADSTFTLTNAGTITKNSGEASAVVSNYATTINNSGTITGAITLNPSQRAATITNSGTINGDIEISSSNAYNSGSNSGGSSITMEEGGVVNGNITMTNAGTRVVGNGGRINGNFTMNNADQSIYFNGLTLNGDILGVSSIVAVQNATFVKESTIIETESFDTFGDSSISLTLSSPSPTASLQIIGAANLSSSTTLNLTISGDIADDEYYTLISATEGLSGGDIDDELIIINNGQNRYNGKAFSVSVIENQLRLIGVDIAVTEIETPFSGARDVFNDIVNDETVNGNLAIIQDILTSNNTSNATKEETLKSVLPQVDNSINRNSFNLINSSVSVATGRIDGLRNGIASGDEAVNKRMWGEVFGNSTAQKGTASNNGYDLNTSGFAMGGDKEISRDNYVGASASYADSSVKGRGVAKSIQAKTYQFNLYNAQTFDKFFLDSVVGFAWNEYNSNRSIAAINSNARANFSGQGYISKIRAGSVIDLPASFTLAPELAITAAHNRVDSYTETGAANANLQVRSSSANFFETRAGFALSHRSALKGSVVIPQFRLSYGHDFAGARQHATANFVGQSTTFQSQGDAIVRGSTKIGLGLKVYTKGTTTVNADYDVELKSGYRADAGVLRLTHGF